MKGSGKLKTEQRVMEIKRLFATTELNDADIAEMYGVSRTHINAIRNGKHYNDIDVDFIDFKTTYTIIGKNTYSSSISSLKTNVGLYYTIIHYLNDNVYHTICMLYDERPDYEYFRTQHDLFIKRALDK